MSDNPQHELNDELLSAYLDDELSADERALVERRLTDDPDARQTLEQLRNVSQAVREMPQQAVGRDLREPILQKVEAAKAASRASLGPSAGAESGTPLPKLTIGRSPRGWIWASLAVAAALLIMFVQSSDDQNPPIGGVAGRTNEASIEKEKLARDVPQLRAWNEPAAPESAPGLAAVDAPASESAAGLAAIDSPAPVPSELADAPAAGAPAQTGHALSPEGAPAAVELGASAPSDAKVSELNGTLDSATTREAVTTVGEDELVVVQVVAKRTALENKSFDKLLADNGIAVEPETAAEQKESGPSAYRPQAASGPEGEELADRLSGDAAGCEAVLVEAPPSAIKSCMQELNQDAINYLCVSVDDSESTDEVSALEVTAAKKLATDLGKYSRGIVSQQYKDAFNRDKVSYYQFDASGQDARGSQSFSGGRAGFGAVQQEAAQSPARKSEMGLGRARRVQPSVVENAKELERSDRFEALADAEPQVDALKQRAMLRQLKSPASADSENWQVLFLLCPSEETAPSPAAANRAE